MRNHIYEVMWNYPEEDEWRDLHQYVLIYDRNSDLGKRIEAISFASNKEIENFDKYLYKLCGLRDEDICFYLNADKEPTENEMRAEALESADIVIKEILGKKYI